VKKKLYLKPFIIPVVYSILVVGLIISIFISVQSSKDNDNNTYVSSTILDENIPVINTTNPETLVSKPYNNEGITIGRNYYDYKDTEEEQKKSIVYHEGIYLQNTGVDYVLNDIFEVISILDGEVMEVEEEELLGKSVTIKHNNNVISVYQSLSEITVQKGDKVTQGQVIGKSGTCNLGSDLGNHLHFELTIDGQIVDPENYYGKNEKELKTETNTEQNIEQNTNQN